MRSKTVDVSEIAKKFGGGGHAGAAGFFHKEFLLGIPE
jgi:nanoRNase/pAp phosphatase (c-di-AMP/oligoRNAs hydrolase)